MHCLDMLDIIAQKFTCVNKQVSSRAVRPIYPKSDPIDRI